MDRWVGSVAFVTGASSGIGKAIAEKLVESGLKVVAVARRKDKLDEIAKALSSKKGKLYPLQVDVSKEEDILKAFKWTKENVGPVSILINNAGVLQMGSFTKFDTKDWANTLNVNVLGPCIATKEGIKQMQENNIDGHIIHINSTAGIRIVTPPTLHIYQGSKHALKAMTETLRLELSLSGSKIKITSISPGAVKTEMLVSVVEGLGLEPKAALSKTPLLEADDIADAILFVLSTPKHVQIPELTIQPVGEQS